jgi:hypothetical protein
MLDDALRFPRSGDDWLPTLIIGGVLSLLGVLILPALVVQGYLVRVLQAGARDETTAPSFTEWGGLFVDGLKLLVVNLGYALATVIPVTIVVAVLAAATGATDASDPNVLLSLVNLGVGLLLLVLSLLVTFVLPAAMANFAIQGRLRAAFDVSTVARGAFTWEYAVGWLLGVVVAVVGGLIGVVLSALVVGVFVLFYVQVVVYFLWGRGFAAGLGREPPMRRGPTAVSA